MRQFIFPFILLLTAVFCYGAESSHTLELLRQNVPARSFEITGNSKKGYHIQTDRYDVMTFQLEDGNLVGERLEHLAHVWKLLAAKYMKKVVKEPAHRHQIVLYRDKQEYVVFLIRFDPFITQSNGYYYLPVKTAYFFSPDTKILFHEGTHQLLAEHFFQEKTPVFRNNFWVVEGIALFMETLKVEENSYKIGDILADRLFAAKKYRFERNYNLPIRQLAAMSAARIQGRTDDLQQIYSQSAALVHWLMFAEKGHYRSQLFELLRQTYHDSAKPETLSELTGLSYEELDKRYVEFLETIPENE